MPDRPNFPIPADLTPDTICLQIEIPNDPTWKQVFVGLLAQPGYWFNWERDNARSGKVLAQYWTKLFDQIDWSNMSCCCNQTILYRYDVDGNLETSTDGGVTWTPAPGNDIRVNPTVLFPPPVAAEGVDITCQSADSAVVLIKQQIGDQLTDDMSRYTLNQLINDWTANIVGASGPFQALAVIITNQIFALLISAVRAALTDAVYDKLRCIFQANMDSTAFFDGAAWEASRTQILSQITGIAGVFLEHLVYLIGNGGLSNLARSGAGDPDAFCCPDCSVDIWSVTSLAGVPVGSIIEVGLNYLIVQSVAHPSFGGLTGEISINTTGANDCCFITSVEFPTGEEAVNMQMFDVDCGNPVYPGSSLTGWDGTNQSNSFQIRKPLATEPIGTQFQAKIFFS